MIHELLVALLGHTGAVFVDDDDDVRAGGGGAGPAAGPAGGGGARPGGGGGGGGNESGSWRVRDPLDVRFRLAADLPFVTASEREVLDRLVRLGYHYRELHRFAKHERHLLTSPHTPSPTSGHVGVRVSLHRHALALGIDEQLDSYRNAVVGLESALLLSSSDVPVLACAQGALQAWEVLLPPLHALVWRVQGDGLKGGAMMNLMHARTHCGVPALQTAFRRLLWQCHQVMYRQLAAWMVHGQLIDKHAEFFIRKRRSLGVDNMNAHLTGRSEDAMEDWHSGYDVRVEMLPSYLVSIPTAQKIEFVGKAVRVLMQPSKNRTELLPTNEVQLFAAQLQELQVSTDTQRLQFEKVINDIRSAVARHLWQLVVVQADLPGHLQALKDYFLLARGDFFQCFMEESRALMRMPPRPATAQHDLNVPFQQSALKSSAEDDKYFARVKLSIPTLADKPSTSDTGEDVPAYDAWDCVSLTYKVEWPLQLLLTKEAMARYNTVFQYLFRLKRLQLMLDHAWVVARQKDQAGGGNTTTNNNNTLNRARLFMPVWRLRQHMAYLVTNLQYYIQVDVIESQYALLQQRVSESNDFNELVRAHAECLNALVSQTFLNIGTISSMLNDIIRLCLSLCQMIESDNFQADPNTVEQLTQEFNRKSNYLYTVLRSNKLAGSQSAPMLRQFLLRLNYNSFFTTAARDILAQGAAGMRPRAAVG
eukprot:jgi/Chlat1/1826/Chrsp138S02145